MVGLTAVARLFVRVTVCAALVVATVCAAKVRVAGAKVKGKAAAPLASTTCWLMAASSVITTAPLIAPLAPNAGAKVTSRVQEAFAASLRFAEQGFDPAPAAEKSPVVAIDV